MWRASSLFVDPEGEAPLTELYAELTGESTDYADVLRVQKHRVLREVLGSDVNRLTALLVEVCESHRDYRDHTRHELHEVLRELIACFPVYRTYVGAEAESVSAQDEKYIRQAIDLVRDRRPEFDARLLDFLRDLLLRRIPGERETELVLRFQQVTGPAMAKGAEDTTFYVYNRLVSLNEVGGDPGRFGLSVREFHEASQAAQWRWPRGLLATSTHDSKRGEDVRARIGVLSEVPEAWGRLVRGWFERHRPAWGAETPDLNAQYLLYQTLVGAWPISVERTLAYMEKAVREAKVHTSWIAPSACYERALRDFVTGALADPGFVADLEAFLPPVVEAGRVNSLAMKLLCLTAPGAPDLYQGSELWDLSLVDPDNRRPVDFTARERLLDELLELGPAAARVAWERRDEGLPKLLLVQRALALRAERPGLFAGSYEPLPATGARARHVVAFLRGAAAAVVVPRFAHGLAGDWADTAVDLPAGRWVDRIGGRPREGGPAPLSELLAGFPVALLARDG
jgi:(1->4)-alpha-D-glucan 1-alpha-D-glucosylmutase